MLTSRYFMKIDWNIFREKRCLYCLRPFFPKKSADPLENHIANNLCPECANKLKELRTGFCRHCGEILPDPGQSVSRCGHCREKPALWDDFSFFNKYEGILREFILSAKFSQNRACMKFLGELLALHFLNRNQDIRKINIVPMPLHNKRLMQRGYNQCLEILKFFARRIEKHTDKTVHIHTNLLQKKFHTVPQHSLNKKERQKNIKNSFSVSKHALKEIFLFDDIATTNSTLEEACKELKKSGIGHIHILVLAKA
ncbi:ComF family protein [Taurinivorans muris]|jgi:Predicted amidophosphoribosyltransferases|uniref:ComF family protein n=1 Tax=Taurinivorans muris TaxID=2787751 RepID=A0ABY5Y0A3_9BACT|nr:ComF family protein [Desulfovibrionaceae bacterium LT0009]